MTHTAPVKWPDHPNLRLRPSAPNFGRGRMQRQIARCFMVCGPVVSSSRVYDWVFARKRKLTEFNRFDVWRILIEIAEPVARAPTIGRPWLWQLRDQSESRTRNWGRNR